jgi:hypothetical protein
MINTEEEFPSLPDFSNFMAQRIANKTKDLTPKFDPHNLMVKKHKETTGETPIDTPKFEWPEGDMKALNDFCEQNGIMGFNCGKMHPTAALAMLKSKVGNYKDVPLTERVPFGYEKAGGANPHNANFPYASPQKPNKVVIYG